MAGRERFMIHDDVHWHVRLKEMGRQCWHSWHRLALHDEPHWQPNLHCCGIGYGQFVTPSVEDQQWLRISTQQMPINGKRRGKDGQSPTCPVWKATSGHSAYSARLYIPSDSRLASGGQWVAPQNTTEPQTMQTKDWLINTNSVSGVFQQ